MYNIGILNKHQTQQKGRRKRTLWRTRDTEPAPPVTSVLFVPKTQSSGLAKRLQEAEHRLAAVTRERVRVVERGGKGVLQLLHTNDPFAGAPCGRASCIPCNNSEKEKKENCDKRGILYETFCVQCEEVAKTKKARGEEAVTYRYVGKSHLAMADRGALHLADSRRGMAGKFDGSHMARHTLEMHPGEAPKFGMTIVRTYTSSFTLAMGEVIRILYRSREKGVVLLNSKAGDFAAYSLPRLSVMNWEEEQKPSSSNSSGSNLCHRDESRNGSNSDLRVKPKVKFKTPCFDVKAKTMLARRECRGPGI